MRKALPMSLLKLTDAQFSVLHYLAEFGVKTGT